MSVTFPNVVCETFGMRWPNVAWFINGKEVSESYKSTDEWSFDGTVSNGPIDKPDMWHTVATGTLIFNKTSSSIGTIVELSCQHKMSTGEYNPSDHIRCKQSVGVMQGLTTHCSLHMHMPSHSFLTSISILNDMCTKFDALHFLTVFHSHSR